MVPDEIVADSQNEKKSRARNEFGIPERLLMEFTHDIYFYMGRDRRVTNIYLFRRIF